MHESKNTISTNYMKKKQPQNITPFDSYNSLTKQRNPHLQSGYLTSSRKKSNRSLLEQQKSASNSNHICLKHSLPIVSVCFTCNFQLLCQQCSKIVHSTQNLSSQDHDIRSLQKSSLFIKNTLIHSQIKLQAKCNILTNINQQLNNHKIQLYTQKNDYKQQLNKTFTYLHQVLQIKLKQMYEQIQQIYQDNDKKFQQTIEEIKSLQLYYEKCQLNINEVLENNAGGVINNNNINNNSINSNGNDFNICHFYYQKRNIIEDIVKQAELKQFKKHIYELKYKIENSEINQIIKTLNDIEIGYDIKYTYFNTQQQNNLNSRQSSLKKVISKVKSQNQLKLKPSKKKLKKPIRYLDLQKTQKPNNYVESRLQKQRQSHKANGTFCTSTPKQNVSRQKKFDMLKKSPQCPTALLKKRKKSFGKMISMPASPAKEQKNQRLSPSNKTKDQILQGMKKKTAITKKKK